MQNDPGMDTPDMPSASPCACQTWRLPQPSGVEVFLYRQQNQKHFALTIVTVMAFAVQLAAPQLKSILYIWLEASNSAAATHSETTALPQYWRRKCQGAAEAQSALPGMLGRFGIGKYHQPTERRTPEYFSISDVGASPCAWRTWHLPRPSSAQCHC